MKSKNVAVVDVRTTQEFAGGHVEGSINIPMDEIMERLQEIKELNQPLVLCCASGNRSGQVASYLNGIGIVCENAGSWVDVESNYQIN